jgi:hypothetical protein
MSAALVTMGQITKGTAMALGLRKFLTSDEGKTLQASFGRGNNKILRITLNGKDLYDVEATKMSFRTFEITKRREFFDVGCEELNRVLMMIESDSW